MPLEAAAACRRGRGCRSRSAGLGSATSSVPRESCRAWVSHVRGATRGSGCLPGEVEVAIGGLPGWGRPHRARRQSRRWLGRRHPRELREACRAWPSETGTLLEMPSDRCSHIEDTAGVAIDLGHPHRTCRWSHPRHRPACARRRRRHAVRGGRGLERQRRHPVCSRSIPRGPITAPLAWSRELRASAELPNARPSHRACASGGTADVAERNRVGHRRRSARGRVLPCVGWATRS